MTTALTLEDQLATELGLDHLTPLKGGRTNSVWQSGAVVVKLYTLQGDTPLFGNSPDHEWHALNALQGTKIAPEPIALKDTSLGKALIYGHITGALGYASLDQAAALLGRLHRLGAKAGLPVTPAGQDVLEHGCAMLPADHHLHALKPQKTGTGPITLVHRDPVFTNFVTGADGLRLVDWQCPAMGDPVEDLAHFISPAMNVLYRGKPLSQAEIFHFLKAYPDQTTVQNYQEYGLCYHWRMACYCAWQVAQGNTDYQAALTAETHYMG